MSDFDFSGVRGDVAADIQTANEQTVETPAATPDPGAGTGQTVQQQAAQTATPTGQTTPEGEPLYDVKINGKSYRVPLSELQAGYSRTADYTQKTMALAQREREWQGYIQQREAELQRLTQIVNDPRVQQLLQAQRAGTAPDEVPTTEQVQVMLRNQVQELEQRLQMMQAQATEELEVRNLAARYSQEVDTTITALMDKNPILKRVRGIDRLLREDVAERQPQSIDEAKRYFIEAATIRARELAAEIQQQQTQQAVAAAQQLRGIEPPGGTVVPPPTAGKAPLGSKDLTRAAIEDIQRLMK